MRRISTINLKVLVLSLFVVLSSAKVWSSEAVDNFDQRIADYKADSQKMWYSIKRAGAHPSKMTQPQVQEAVNIITENWIKMAQLSFKTYHELLPLANSEERKNQLMLTVIKDNYDATTGSSGAMPNWVGGSGYQFGAATNDLMNKYAGCEYAGCVTMPLQGAVAVAVGVTLSEPIRFFKRVGNKTMAVPQPAGLEEYCLHIYPSYSEADSTASE